MWAGNPSYPNVIDERKKKHALGPAMSLPRGPLSQQYCRAGSPCHQTADPCEPWLPFFGRCRTNHPRLRSNAYDPQGTGSMASKGSHRRTSPLHQMHLGSHHLIDRFKPHPASRLDAPICNRSVQATHRTTSYRNEPHSVSTSNRRSSSPLLLGRRCLTRDTILRFVPVFSAQKTNPAEHLGYGV